MELLLKQTLRSALRFLGIVFIVCGVLLFFYYTFFLPPYNPIFGLYFNLPSLIPAILILCVGLALNMVSKAL